MNVQRRGLLSTVLTTLVFLSGAYSLSWASEHLSDSYTRSIPGVTQCKDGDFDPVEPYSGDYYFKDGDLTLFPGAPPINIVRSYTHSQNEFVSTFGVGSYLDLYDMRIWVPKNLDGTVNKLGNQSLALDGGNGLKVFYTNGAAGGLVFENHVDLGPKGVKINVHVDERNFLKGITHEGPSGLTHFFDAQGRLVAIEDVVGNRVNLLRNASGQLIEIKNDKHSVKLRYNPEGLVENISSGNYKASYRYDAQKRLVLVIRRGVTGTTNVFYVWDSKNRINWAKYPDRTVLNTYAENNMMRQQVLNRNGDVEIYRLDMLGPLLRQITDHLGNIRTLEYDSRGILIREEKSFSPAAAVKAAPTNGKPDALIVPAPNP